MVFNIFRDSTKTSIKKAALEVQALVNHRITKVYESQTENIEVSAEGLTDYQRIITQYLDVNEQGLALEHLLYVILELELEISDSLRIRIEQIRQKLNIPTTTGLKPC